ncbi:hypothetical protein I4U23_027586 [Adineta vaga]|nr:hypothetical protein I4U23_027586 [Adineta vaga]
MDINLERDLPTTNMKTRPLNATPSGSTAEILIYQKYFWNRQWGTFPAPDCTEPDVTAKRPIPVNAYMVCLQNCSSSTYPTIGLSTIMTTTDCQTSSIINSWAGERYERLTLPLTTSITMGYTSNQWMQNLYGCTGGRQWSIVNRLNLALRPDGFINSSPVTNSLPVILYPINTPIVHVVQMADNDPEDTPKCRWSNSDSVTNYNRHDECGCICNGMISLGATLEESTCTLSFILPTENLYYPVALQIEDYYNINDTSPMSSVPIQFLFYGYKTNTSACINRPSIIGVRPNRACIGVPIDVEFNETIIIETYCSDQTINDMVTSSPYGMTHSNIARMGIGSNLWKMVLTWKPIVDQTGPQSFCTGAIDNYNVQSDPWCITYLVGYNSTDLIPPTSVQSSASPIGTVFQNHSIFYIQAIGTVGRPTRNGTYIRFHEADTNATVLYYDAGYASNIVYTGPAIVIITNYTWTPGKSYYITMDSGFASANEFCHAESKPISDPTFWRYNIWDPAVSSTTTTTTTPFTTITVTTKPTSTTSVNTLLTTTGIVITTTLPVTTTALTTSTSTATPITTTAGIIASTLSAESTIIDPKKMEEVCKYPLLIMNVLMMVALMPIHTLIMYAGFTKFSNMFNPVHINAKRRHEFRMRRILAILFES